MRLITRSLISAMSLTMVGLIGLTTVVIADDFPRNTVIFTTARACPSGYSHKSELMGRFLVATPQNGTVGWTFGDALKDKVLPTHTHDINSDKRYGGGSRSADRGDETSPDTGTWLPFVYLTACVKQ